MVDFELLANMRAERAEEYADFVSSPALQTLLNRTLGFLTDEESTALTLNLAIGGDSSFTNGRSITLGMMDYFFAEHYGPLDWTAVLKALLAHEVQHINSSNFSDMEGIAKEYVALAVPQGMPEGLAQKIATTYLNIMEDSRIENIIIHKLPGYHLPLILVNGEIRNAAEIAKRAERPGEEFSHFQSQCLCYAITGNNVPGVQVYHGHRLETEFLAVRHLFDEAVEARTSNDCRNICMTFLKETLPYFLELMKSEQAQQEAEQGMGMSVPEYTSDGEKEFNESSNGSGGGGSGQQQSSGSNGNGTGQQGNQPGNAGTGDSNENGGTEAQQSGSGQSADVGKNSLRISKDMMLNPDADFAGDFSNIVPDHTPEVLTREELAQIRRGVHDEIRAEERRQEDAAAAKRRQGKDLNDISAMYEQTVSFKETFPVINNQQLPSELITQGRRLENVFERILRQKRTEKRGMRAGRLDGRSLYRTGMDDPHIFMRKGQPMKADIAVFFLMDNSGSMNGCGAKQGEQSFSKSALSRFAASVIEFALRNFAAIKISLFSAGGGRVEHHTLKKFDEKTDGGKAYNSLPVVGAGGGNKDGYSIRVATKELLARREAKKVLLLLSDGKPSSYSSMEEGIADVKSAVKEAKRKGIIVIPIMYGDKSFREGSADDYKEMYGEYISCDPAEVTEKFQKLFVDLIRKS